MTKAQALSPTDDTLRGAAAAWGSLVSMNLGAGLSKLLFPVIGAYGITALRVAIAAAILCAIVRPWRRRIPRGVLPALLGYGAVLGVMNISFYQAIARIPIGIAIGIEVLGPLAVAVMGSRTRRDFLFLAVAIAGLLLLLPIRADSRLDPVGVAFALGAAICWALYILCGKRVSGALGQDAVALGLAIAAAIAVPVGVASAGALLFTPWVLAAGLGIALLSSAIPYTLEMAAMRRLPAHVFSLLLSASPAVGAVIGFLLLGEVLTATQGLAILCIMLAAGGSAMSAARSRSKDIPPENFPIS
ncbi:MAG: EamA family transporter [Sphingomonadales bacterium]|nr:EamA family transporter [Sphingomonadales bacterium]